MVDYVEKIKELEDELKKTKYNKKTQHHIGLTKAKLAQLKEKQISRGKGGKKGEGYSVRKAGDASVILIGFPSAGKSTLLNSVTGADSPVAEYEFTTLDVVPGMLEHKDAKIQILDVPGIVAGAASGRGRGREVLSVIQNADFIIIVIDVNRPQALDVIKKELFDAHIRMNQHLCDIKLKKTSKGGIKIGRTVKTPKLTNETIKTVLKEFRIMNADIVIRERIDTDQLIDTIEGNKKYIPGIVVLNKIDMVSKEELEKVVKKIKPDLMISAKEKVNMEELKHLIFNRLDFIRVYCKEVGKKADMGVPLIMTRGDTLKDMCLKLHKDFLQNFKFSKIWGPSVKFGGQRVMKLKHKLKDMDVVELHIR